MRLGHALLHALLDALPALRAPESRSFQLPASGPLRAAAFFYGAGAALHRALHRLGIRPCRRLPCRVVSVGSLVVGGSAKTPTAAWIAARLHERGHKVALASRGYGGRAREPVTVVSDGQRLLADAASVGDEPLVLARRAPGVPVLVGRNRGRVGLRGREVGVGAGLANPEGFERTVEALGARVVARRLFADHHAYAPEDLEGMEGQARCWVTSEKDALKIAPGWLGGVDLRVLVIELEVEDSGWLMGWLDGRLREGV